MANSSSVTMVGSSCGQDMFVASRGAAAGNAALRALRQLLGDWPSGIHGVREACGKVSHTGFLEG